MKYIRTKDGIIYVGDLIKDEYGNYCDPKNYDTDMEVPNEYIIAEADAIKELCDRFVFIDKKYQEEKHRYLVYTRLFEKKNLPKYIQNGTEIYGAIWCEWGLKYVAKLNNKGEFELI